MTGLSIENFRSIEKADLPLSRINVFTGANNSGKSSVIYALAVYKSFMDNPNRTLDQILTLPFISMGPFKEVVFDKDEGRSIFLKLDFFSRHKVDKHELKINQRLILSPTGSKLEIGCIEPIPFSADISIALPYPLNNIKTVNIPTKEGEVSVKWNGIYAESQFSNDLNNLTEGKSDILSRITASFNFPKYQLDDLTFAPIERGFKKPSYGAVQLNDNSTYTEDEIATIIARDHDLAGRIAHYLEKIVDRYFVVNSLLGTSSFRLQTRDKQTGFTSDLVNEGVGTGQLVTLLAKILQKDIWTICIDEPEIHLHPSIIDKLLDTIIEISENEEKQFIFSTHSEHLVQSLLMKIKEGKLKPKDVNIFYTTKNKKRTEFELQPINDKGQIEGGLKSFYETELSNMKDFFKAD